jgi:hypothetical protein
MKPRLALPTPLLLALMVFSFAESATAADIIMESRRGGLLFERYNELTGPWMDSNTPALDAKSQAPGLTRDANVGSRKVILSTALNQTSAPVIAAARYRVEVPQPGLYYVYATWPRAANANPVIYRVVHGTNDDAVPMVQDGWGAQGRPNGSTWNLIGGFEFTGGGEEFVELRVPQEVVPTDPRSLGQAFADGLRLSSRPLTPMEMFPETPAGAQGGTATPTPLAGGRPALSEALPGANSALNWSTNFAQARSEAAATNRGLLLFFVNAGSDRVRRIETQVLDTPEVRQALEGRFVPVKIDMATNEDLTRQLHVFRAGTVLLYDRQSNPLAEISDPRTPADIVSRLR